jgi:hypothetical protein
MKPTSWWLLAALLAFAGGLAYVLVNGFHSLLPVVSVRGPIAVGLAAAVVAALAGVTRARLAGRPGTRPIVPLAVARLAALGKASALVGAPVAGIYAGLLGRVLQLDSSVARSDVGSTAVGVGCGLLLTVAGLALETVCRVKQPPQSVG